MQISVVETGPGWTMIKLCKSIEAAEKYCEVIRKKAWDEYKLIGHYTWRCEKSDSRLWIEGV